MTCFTDAFQAKIRKCAEEKSKNDRRLRFNPTYGIRTNDVDTVVDVPLTVLNDDARAVLNLQERIEKLRKELVFQASKMGRREEMVREGYGGEDSGIGGGPEQISEGGAGVAAALAQRPTLNSWDYINLSDRHRQVVTGQGSSSSCSWSF